MNVRKLKLFGIATLMLCALWLPVSGLAKDDKAKGANPGILPLRADAYGASYPEWAAKWWQWMGSFPADRNPGSDTTGQFAALGQSGHVWFLADISPGMLGPEDAITRTCDVPVGKALFFPVWNVIWWTVPGVDCPEGEDPLEWFLENEGWIRELMASVSVQMVYCEIDGRVVRNLDLYHLQSPVFSLDLPENNIMGAEPGVYTACMSDGTYLMLAPLSVGRHTIHSLAVLEWDYFPGSHHYVDITYNLSVIPGAP